MNSVSSKGRVGDSALHLDFALRIRSRICVQSPTVNQRTDIRKTRVHVRHAAFQQFHPIPPGARPNSKWIGSLSPVRHRPPVRDHPRVHTRAGDTAHGHDAPVPVLVPLLAVDRPASQVLLKHTDRGGTAVPSLAPSTAGLLRLRGVDSVEANPTSSSRPDRIPRVQALQIVHVAGRVGPGWLCPCRPARKMRTHRQRWPSRTSAALLLRPATTTIPPAGTFPPPSLRASAEKTRGASHLCVLRSGLEFRA